MNDPVCLADEITFTSSPYLSFLDKVSSPVDFNKFTLLFLIHMLLTVMIILGIQGRVVSRCLLFGVFIETPIQVRWSLTY